MRAVILTFALFTLVGCGSPEGAATSTTSSAGATISAAVSITDGCYDLSRVPDEPLVLTFAGTIQVPAPGGAILRGSLLPSAASPVNPSTSYRVTQRGDRADIAISQTFAPIMVHSKLSLSAYTVGEIRRNSSGLVCANFIDTKPTPFIDRVTFWGTAGEGQIRLLDENGAQIQASNGWAVEL